MTKDSELLLVGKIFLYFCLLWKFNYFHWTDTFLPVMA